MPTISLINLLEVIARKWLFTIKRLLRGEIISMNDILYPLHKNASVFQIYLKDRLLFPINFLDIKECNAVDIIFTKNKKN